METPALSKRLETYVSAALSKIQDNPDLTPRQALSKATTLRFPQSERSLLIRTIKLRRPPKPKKFDPKKNRIDAERNDLHHRLLLGKDF
jgi:hypothetical protein